MSFVNIFDSRPSFQKMFLFFLFSCDICPGFSSATTGTAEPLLTRCLARSETSWQRTGQVIEAALRKRSQEKKMFWGGKFEEKNPQHIFSENSPVSSPILDFSSLRWTKNPPQLTTQKPLFWVLLILALPSTWRSTSASGSDFGSRRPSSMGWRSSTLTTWPSLSALVLSFWHRWPVEQKQTWNRFE